MSVPSKFYLFQRNNGVWYLGYSEEGRKRWKSTGCTTKADALKAISDLKELLRQKPKPILLSNFSEEYFAYAEKNLSSATVLEYRRAVRDFIRLIGDCQLSAITQRHADQFKVKRLAEHVSPVRVNIQFRSLKAVLGVAMKWRMLSSNPFSNVPLLKVPDTLPVFITKPQLDTLISVVDVTWLKEIILFAVSTGMRRGEILNLRWQDVDLSRRLIRITSSDGFNTKSGNCRTIPISDFLLAILKSKASTQSASVENEYVFTYKGRKIAGVYLTHQFKRAVRSAGLSERIHFHSLRHSHASWLVQAGVSLFAVSKLLGHSSVIVTEKHYAALAPESLHDEVNRIQISLS